MANITIEVCCGSVDDAVRAYEAGADRVELNLALDAGGLTPSIGMVRAAAERIGIPIICMLRPRAGGFCYSELEFESMLGDVKPIMRAGAAGLAFGILNMDGTLDKDRCRRIIDEAGGGEMVFHRAFDVMRGDPVKEAREIAETGFARILTSGRERDALSGAGLIRRVNDAVGQRIELLAGGGVRPHNAAEIIGTAGVRQVHFTFHTSWEDVSARSEKLSFDAPEAAPCAVKTVDGEGLANFVRELRAMRLN